MDERNKSTQIWIGIGVTALAHLLFAILMFAVNGMFALLLIGGSQLIYIIPLSVIFAVKKRSGIVAGLWIGAGITFLLNAACFGIGFGSLFFGGL